MTEKVKVPASGTDERGSKRRLRTVKRVGTPGSPTESVQGIPPQREHPKYKDDGPPARQ